MGGAAAALTRAEGEQRLSASLTANMDAAGIDFQVLSPNPLTYFHHIGASEAVSFCRGHNDALAEIVSEHPSRLAGFAALPMQDIAAACEELDRAVTELDLLGGYIGTDIGRPLNDPELDRFYERVVKLDVPLMIHPSPAGIDGPAGDPNLKQFDLDLLTGFAAQESIAGALNEAEKVRKEMEELAASNENQLKEARAERDRMLREAREMADQLVADAKNTAREAADKEVAAAKDAIAIERKAAVAELKAQVGNLSLEIAERLLREKLESNDEQKALVNRLIDESPLN